MKIAKEITLKTTVQAPVEKGWKCRTEPTPYDKMELCFRRLALSFTENDLREGGKFNTRMEAKDGSFYFDFGGVYDEIKPYKIIAYTMVNGRKMKITFNDQGKETEIIETFEAGTTKSIDLQQQGWQAILTNFKKYVERISD